MATAESLNRRGFIKETTMGGIGWFLQPSWPKDTPGYKIGGGIDAMPWPAGRVHKNLDLSPAVWIWYPSQRCLQNTFIFFRKEIALTEIPVATRGWLLGESRYLLFVNGQRVQWGPAPSDPRYSEADPLHLVHKYLKKGKNVIGVQCLFYGQGDGTWPIGKPGLIARLDIKFKDGKAMQVVTDDTWQARLATAWRPGNYKRWYLRALQEERDDRLYPRGWNDTDLPPDNSWHAAMVCGHKASKPAICNGFPSYDYEIAGEDSSSFIRPRSVPFMKETLFPVRQLTESMWLNWKIPVREYFDCGTPDAFEVVREVAARKTGGDEWEIESRRGLAALLTFEWAEQAVGWPCFSIKASEGTVVELLVHEAHQPGGPALINSHFNSWSRFICREGWNYFETMDFESCRWLQLHIRDYTGNVRLKGPGMRRRQYPWKETPVADCGDRRIQQVIKASVNTLNNCAQDTITDGMGRERQQYSGDGSHQLHAIYSTMGDTKLPARFVNTFGQGLMLEGYFFDSWPAYDRLARTMERQLQLSGWGPILDHSVGFCLDCWNYYLYTGDLTALAETFPRLLRFFRYLQSIRSPDGLLPVEGLGLPCIWMDHDAYTQQREKQCAFNLYVSAMCIHGLAPLSEAFKQFSMGADVKRFGTELLEAAIAGFWSKKYGAFVNNLPWIGLREPRYDDRSLATSILFDQCPDGQIGAAVNILAKAPSNLGLSYPANAIWRFWGLAKGGEIQAVIDDLRTRWYGMDSVRLNNTLQETWHAEPDSGSEWSHCAVGPLIIMHMGIAGIRPTGPGYTSCEIRPQFGSLSKVKINTHTVKGPIELQMEGKPGYRHFHLQIPAGMEAKLVVDARETLSLPEIAQEGLLKKYRLSGGQKLDVILKYA